MNREEELELLKQVYRIPEQKFNNVKIRTKAASYAKTFLAKKYREEYKELYEAYLRNRGYTTRASKELLDERLVSE